MRVHRSLCAHSADAGGERSVARFHHSPRKNRSDDPCAGDRDSSQPLTRGCTEHYSPVSACTETETTSLERVVHRPLLLQIAVDRAARLLEEVVGVPRRAEFKDEAAQHSRVRRSCLSNLVFRRADSIRHIWQHLRALPRCVNTYIPPIRTAAPCSTRGAIHVPHATDQ